MVAHPLRRCSGGDPGLVARARGYRRAGDSCMWTRLCRHAPSAATAAASGRTGTRQARRPARPAPTARVTHYRTQKVRRYDPSHPPRAALPACPRHVGFRRVPVGAVEQFHKQQLCVPLWFLRRFIPQTGSPRPSPSPSGRRGHPSGRRSSGLRRRRGDHHAHRDDGEESTRSSWPMRKGFRQCAASDGVTPFPYLGTLLPRIAGAPS